MRRKISFLTVFVLGLALWGVKAQNATITFQEKKHNFGTIEERGGRAVHKFEFKNTGSAPLIIQRVTASCGCTTPNWTKSPVEPGKTGFIEVSYNPIGRPGAFTKSISVFSNATNEREILYISGHVNRGQTAVQNQTNSNVGFSARIGDLQLSSNRLSFGNLAKGDEVKSRTISVQNASASTMTVQFTNLPAHLEVQVQPQVLKPSERGTITINYNPAKAVEWGPVEDALMPLINGAKDANDKSGIQISAILLEDFSKMSTAEKQKAPILEVKSKNLHFGTIKKGSRVRGQVSIKNSGAKPLEIRRVLNHNSDIQITPVRSSIRGGRTENFKVEINTKFVPAGEYRKMFTVYTNDPMNSVVNFNIGYVVN